MSTSAIVMMVVAMLIIWGGLAVAVIRISKSTDVPTTEELHRDL